jgi:hypothetical protein
MIELPVSINSGDDYPPFRGSALPHVLGRAWRVRLATAFLALFLKNELNNLYLKNGGAFQLMRQFFWTA